ncbi:GroEL-like equatorial domain superfamily [Sesbania bispinosa]|nr:GroEL-like equatorial domain superfamily [Sesbania bispinosa]
MELAELQDKEVGDGTTSIIIVATELLKRANDLVRNKIHPTSIISGYRGNKKPILKVKLSKVFRWVSHILTTALIKFLDGLAISLYNEIPCIPVIHHCHVIMVPCKIHQVSS